MSRFMKNFRFDTIWNVTREPYELPDVCEFICLVKDADTRFLLLTGRKAISC